jgi:hypothetical protein
MVEEHFQATLLQPRFGEGFLEDHAGRIIQNPEIAIVELVANSWDAGARRVDLTWPEEVGGNFEIADNGTGMTREEFEAIWTELNYNRVKMRGHNVEFPDASVKLKRSAYGRNGKGRHSLFCFSDEYDIETWKNDFASVFHVKRSSGVSPYEITLIEQNGKKGHGTRIWCEITKNYIKELNIQEILGTKFITDPDFAIYLNNSKINSLDLQEGIEEEVYSIPGENDPVRILRIDSKKTGRLSAHHGVAWWVNKRLVGEHSWKGFEGAYLDGRTSEAKRFTFIVEADLLRDEVKEDWTWFKDTPRAEKIIQQVNSYIFESIKNLMEDSRKEIKINILRRHKRSLRQLSNLSKQQIGSFVDEIQMRCPTITQRDLSNTVEIFTKMELSRTGYNLLQQLVTLSADDLDNLSEILDNWSINDAKKVLEELDWRLKLIKKIESLCDDPKADELHKLQPLFETGLWIFGPEYEGIQFTSNKSLSTVIKKLFNGGEVNDPKKRPDFVVLPDSSLGIYSSDRYDEDGEVCGIKKVLIVELKRGGSKIVKKHLIQATDYADEIIKCGKIDAETKIICYVLGSKVEYRDPFNTGRINAIPRAYSTILRQAHARTFNLMKKIEDYKNISEIDDNEIREILAQSEIEEFCLSNSET